MSATRVAQTEKQFMAAVVEYAGLRSWLVYHTRDSRGSVAGFPDLVLVKDRAIVFAELKTERGRVSDAQRRWLGRLSGAANWVNATHLGEACGPSGVGVYVWRPSEWEEIRVVLDQ